MAFGRFDEPVERHLGVHRHVPATRQPYHQIWPLPAGRDDLGVEVAVLCHSGDLDHTLQLDLTPPAADLRRPQCPGQRSGLRTEIRRGAVQRSDLLAEGGVGIDAIALHFVQRGLHSVQRLGGRLQCGDELRGVSRPPRRESETHDGADAKPDPQQEGPDHEHGDVHPFSMT